MADNRIIPEYITLHSEVLKIGGEIKNHARRFVEAYTALKSLKDLGGIPADPKDSTDLWLSELIESKLTEVDTLPLTETDKENAREKWLDIKNEAQNHVTAIKEALDAYPLQYVVSDEGLRVTNIDELTEQYCRHKVPPIAQEHFDKFMALYDALLDFRHFEQEHSICPFQLWELIRKARDPKDFALGWVGGGFTSKPDKAYVDQIRGVEQW